MSLMFTGEIPRLRINRELKMKALGKDVEIVIYHWPPLIISASVKESEAGMIK